MIIHPRGELEKMPKILAQDLKPGFLGIEPGTSSQSASRLNEENRCGWTI